jgi:hypothetical protein
MLPPQNQQEDKPSTQSWIFLSQALNIKPTGLVDPAAVLVEPEL